jgi:hypothetical protein
MGSHDWSRLYPAVDAEMRARGLVPPSDKVAQTNQIVASSSHSERNAGLFARTMAFVAVCLAWLRNLAS